MLNYGSLSKNERRAAKKLAKELLRTVPAAQAPSEELLNTWGVEHCLYEARERYRCSCLQ